MRILIVNVGSSAVKYSLFENDSLKNQESFSRKDSVYSTSEEKYLKDAKVDYIVFRVVHTLGDAKTKFLDEKTEAEIKDAIAFAPLHNKLLLDLLEKVKDIYPQEKFIAVFDSEFHATLPQYAYTYPIPREFNLNGKIRKYGFHGLALESVRDKIKEKLGYIPEKIIAVHAGGGVSVTAILDGKSIDTTMGLTPTDGILMLTRSGSLDPEIYRVLHDLYGLDFDNISEILNLKSGFYGLTNSKDTKEIIEKARAGKEPYSLAYKIFLYQIKKTIYSFWGVLGGVDYITLSGGLAYNNEFFLDDLFLELSTLNLSKEQLIRIKVEEEKIMLKKAMQLIAQT